VRGCASEPKRESVIEPMAEGERQAGDVLDERYKLVERLGRGGFGDVWRADELLPDGSSLRQVALKLLHAGLAASGDWSAEARIIASLRHGALVTIYAAGLLALERPTPFVAMELLIGNNLGSFVANGVSVPWRRVLAWARETAAALDTIHRAGVVHLDLKPANLFLPREGGVKVLDFGIARQGRVRTHVAPPSGSSDELSTAAFMVAREQGQEVAGPEVTGGMTHSVVGTPGFMAPEVFEDGEPGPATDAYALAACIVQLTTGQLPQQLSKRPEGEDGTSVHAWFAEVQSATVRGQLRDLGDEHPEIPAALLSLLLRWLALDPMNRHVDSGTMRAQLDEVWTCPHGWHENPYQGLAPYRLEDEGKLFGRAPDVTRIARELFDQPCVVLQGEGGVGLESLAVAGVVPELARTFADDHHDWRICVVKFGTDRTPDQALTQELTRWLERHAIEDIEDPIDALEAWADTSRIGLALVLDDLHLLLEAAPDERREVERLVEWLTQHHPGLRLIGTLPEEHTAEFLEFELGERLRPWLRFMSAPQASLVREIVEGPARAHGRKLRGGSKVVDELQLELQADGSRLPLVSLALTGWWADCDTDLTSEQWHKQGGVIGALATHADEVFEALEPIERERADGLLLRLVSAEGRRLEVARDVLLGRVDDDDSLAALLEVLIAARLVQRMGGALRLSHPDLAERWPRLHERRLHDIDRLTFLEELRAATQRWLAAGRPARLAWGRGRWRELERRMASLSRDLGDDERAFVVATSSRVRLGSMLRALGVAAAIGLVVAGIWFERTREQRARDQERALEYARTNEAVGVMVTRSRRADDPYRQVALLSGAIEMGSADPALPFELYRAASKLPKAKFLSLRKVPRPTFPWGGRWLIGGSGAHAVAFNFDPPEGKDWGPV
jgi:serine/threonine protein kinase